MASLATAVERRRDDRVSAARTSWRAKAVLRPGQGVVLVDIGRGGALVESGVRLRPGLRTELQLSGLSTRRTIRGCLERCYVSGVAPLTYRGVVVFDAAEDLAVGQPDGE